MASPFFEALLEFFRLRKVHNIDPARLSATTTSSFYRFQHPVHRVTLTTDAAVVFALKPFADSNTDIRLQAGQAVELEDVEVEAVAVVTASGTANVDVIGFRRIR